MTTGVTAALPAALRFDDAGSAPGLTWLKFLGIAVGLLPLPLWAIAVSRSIHTRASAAVSA